MCVDRTAVREMLITDCLKCRSQCKRTRSSLNRVFFNTPSSAAGLWHYQHTQNTEFITVKDTCSQRAK